MIDINELRTVLARHGTSVLNEDEILELLDRLEAAESDALEQARLNGMGSEREAALMAKLEAAEKSDAESIAMYRKARDERDAMRARIEAMEKQEPVFWWRPCSDGAYEGPIHNSSIERVRKQSGAWSPLYKLPGAQPTPIIPEGWKLVPIEPTPSMKTAGLGVEVYQDSPPSTDCLTWEEAEAIYTAMIAAAQEAKP